METSDAVMEPPATQPQQPPALPQGFTPVGDDPGAATANAQPPALPPGFAPVGDDPNAKPDSSGLSIRNALSMAADLADHGELMRGTEHEAMTGAVKRGAQFLSHIINIVNDSPSGDLSDIPEYQRLHPGASAKEAWDAMRGVGPDGKPTAPFVPQRAAATRQHLADASKWLADKAKMPGLLESTPSSPIGGAAQHAGGLGFDMASWIGTEGLLRMGMAPEELAGLGGDAGEAGQAVLSAADKYKKAGAVASIFDKYPVIAHLASMGARLAHSVIEGGPAAEQGIVGATQAGVESEGDPKSMALGAFMGAASHIVGNEAIKGATNYLTRTKAAGEAAEEAAAEAAKPPPPPVETPIPPKPEPAELTPAPRPAPPEEPDMPPELAPPPQPPEPVTATPTPEKPTAPTPLEPPAPVTPTPTPPEPTPPELYTPDRVPAEQRFGQLQQDVAQSAGNNAVAAIHLENLNQIIRENRTWQKPLLPAQMEDVLRMRDELLDHVTGGSAPADSEQVVSALGDLGQSADALRAGPLAARARWDELSGGAYSELTGELDKLAGKTDANSLSKAQALKGQIDTLLAAPKFGGTATPAVRAAYDALLSKADILDAGDDAFTKAYTGAGRTGDINFKTLQTNWKNFVNKAGVPEVQSAMGEDRFNAMNDFINEVVTEPAQNKAAQAALDTAHDAAMDEWKQGVKNAKTLDEAKQKTLDSQHAADQSQMDEMHKQELQEWRQKVSDAQSLDQAKRDAQAAEYADTRKAYATAKRVRTKVLANRKAQMQQMTDDYNAQMKQAGGMDKEQKAQIAADHAQQMEAWQADSDRIAAQNKANIAEWKQQNKQSGAGPSADEKQMTAAQIIKAVKTASGLGIGGEILHFLPLPPHVKGAIAGVGTAAYITKRILSNPATARVFMTAVKSGGDPAIYSAVINSMLREDNQKAVTSGASSLLGYGGGNANSR
jgi:hypothetical protein